MKFFYEMQFKCWNKSCNEVLLYELIEKHLCPEDILQCSIDEKCKFEAKRKEVEDHMQNCPYSLEKCKWNINGCDKLIPKIIISEHEEMCKFQNIFCLLCKYEEIKPLEWNEIAK